MVAGSLGNTSRSLVDRQHQCGQTHQLPQQQHSVIAMSVLPNSPATTAARHLGLVVQETPGADGS